MDGESSVSPNFTPIKVDSTIKLSFLLKKNLMIYIVINQFDYCVKSCFPVNLAMTLDWWSSIRHDGFAPPHASSCIWITMNSIQLMNMLKLLCWCIKEFWLGRTTGTRLSNLASFQVINYTHRPLKPEILSHSIVSYHIWHSLLYPSTVMIIPTKPIP